MKKTTTTVAALALAISLSAAVGACSSSSSTSSPEASTSSSPEATIPTDATAVVAALKAKGLPVTLTITYTEETDKNNKLGRPGEYTSKAAFTDSRVKASEAQSSTPGSVDLGGGVEMFPDAAGATSRANYIQTAIKSTGFLAGEYDYVAGGALLRLSPVLTPTEAEQYQAALGEIMGTPAQLIEPPK